MAQQEEEEAQVVRTSVNPMVLNVITHFVLKKLMFVEAKINRQLVVAMMDIGVTHILIAKWFMTRLGMRIMKVPN